MSNTFPPWVATDRQAGTPVDPGFLGKWRNRYRRQRNRPATMNDATTPDTGPGPAGWWSWYQINGIALYTDWGVEGRLYIPEWADYKLEVQLYARANWGAVGGQPSGLQPIQVGFNFAGSVSQIRFFYYAPSFAVYTFSWPAGRTVREWDEVSGGGKLGSDFALQWFLGQPANPNAEASWLAYFDGYTIGGWRWVEAAEV